MQDKDIFDRLKIHMDDFPVSKNPVCISDIEKILDAARWAPSPFNSQPWDFLAVVDKSLEKYIRRLFSKSHSKLSTDIPCTIFDFPSYIVVLYNNLRVDPGRNADQMGLLCLGTCLGNFSLRAAELSVKLESFRFSSEVRKEKVELEQKLKLPEHIKLIAIVGMGYANPTGRTETSCDVLEKYVTKHVRIDYFKKYSEQGNISIPPPIENEVLELVQPRKSYRKRYLKKDVLLEHELQIIKASLSSNCLWRKNHPPWKILLIKDTEIRNKLAKRIQKCAYNAYMNEQYFQKMREWMRFSEKEMLESRDGVFAYAFYKYLGFTVKVGMDIMALDSMKWVKNIMVPVFSKAFFHDLVKTSPLLLVIIHAPNSSGQELEEYETDYMAIGMAIQNILLSSWSLKIGVQFLSILFNEEDSEKEIQKELGIPSDYTIVDIVRMGYIDSKAVPPQYFNVKGNVRRTCSEILHKDTYGNKALP